MIAYIVTAAISVSAGVLGMGAWCGATLERAREDRDKWKSNNDAWVDNYFSEHLKLLEAEQAHADLADKHNAANARIESVISLIDSIPHCKGKETRIKAMLRGETA